MSFPPCVQSVVDPCNIVLYLHSISHMSCNKDWYFSGMLPELTSDYTQPHYWILTMRKVLLSVQKILAVRGANTFDHAVFTSCGILVVFCVEFGETNCCFSCVGLLKISWFGCFIKKNLQNVWILRKNQHIWRGANTFSHDCIVNMNVNASEVIVTMTKTPLQIPFRYSPEWNTMASQLRIFKEMENGLKSTSSRNPSKITNCVGIERRTTGYKSDTLPRDHLRTKIHGQYSNKVCYA